MDHETERTALEVSYCLPGDAWQAEVPTEDVARILAPFEGRKRAFLVRLLNGRSKRAAAAGVGISVRATQLWAKADPDFAEAVAFCKEVGFATVIEDELYRRALAGSQDSGSMRALELVAKSRDPRYRDRVANDVTVTAFR
ncbi:MAG: hypothetical protein ACKVT1_12540 [Dehalococcoidia bacterium]